MVCVTLSDEHLIQFRVITGTLKAHKNQDGILESGVMLPLDSLDGQKMDLTIFASSRNKKNQQNIASLPWPSLLLDLNPIEHVWDKLG